MYQCKQKKTCISCGSKIRGFAHSVYKPNGIIKPTYFCEKCYQEKGRPLQVSIKA